MVQSVLSEQELELLRAVQAVLDNPPASVRFYLFTRKITRTLLKGLGYLQGRKPVRSACWLVATMLLSQLAVLD